MTAKGGRIDFMFLAPYQTAGSATEYLLIRTEQK